MSLFVVVINYLFGLINKLLISSKPTNLIDFNLMFYSIREIFSESNIVVDDFSFHTIFYF